MKISIASGKGGTGKTTLSTNLSAYLTEKSTVVLADLDVEEPNSGLFIQGKLVNTEDKYKMIPEWKEEACTLCGLCQEVCNFNAVIRLGTQIMVFPQLCHSCYACSELCQSSSLPMISQKIGQISHYKRGKLDFVESRLDVGEEQAVPLISQTIKYIDQHFSQTRFKIFDAPPGTSCPVIEATKDSDFIILVTEPTPFGLHDLKLAVETMRSLNKAFAVVINRYGIGNDEVLEYCQNEKKRLLAKIPNSRRIAELYSRGELVFNQIPEMAQALKDIEDYLLKLSAKVLS
ncbi:MAG: P-loop NTPase [Bacteroidetes bacterium]|nr:P-loop NTPase [Bacteroidota bacterium]MBT5425294.1 P-loop NTPase [Bacteroidota bacterium]MBT7464108.1 P-loop NTPase [Bacteroidota bacterium]